MFIIVKIAFIFISLTEVHINDFRELAQSEKLKPGEGNISSSLLTEFELADNKLLEKWGHIHTLCYILLNKSKFEKHMNSLLLKKIIYQYSTVYVQ